MGNDEKGGGDWENGRGEDEKMRLVPELAEGAKGRGDECNSGIYASGRNNW